MIAARGVPVDGSVRGARRWIISALLACCVGAAGAPAASAASASDSGATGPTGTTGSTATPGTTANPVFSSNWAGYAVTGTRGAVRHFDHVTATWVQPAAVCTAGSGSYSAFWVGLGGLSQSSKKLEQTGTEADCDSDGVAHYYAWYELVPAGPVTVRLAIAPGNSVSASVSVHGAYVTMHLVDATTGDSISKRLRFPHANLGSAEWIAEAPSECAASCQALPLTDFGSVGFTGASARAADGLSGPIASPDWSAQAIGLRDRSAIVRGSRFFGPPEVSTALPTVLDATGSAFAVDWAQEQLPAGPGGGRYFPGASV